MGIVKVVTGFYPIKGHPRSEEEYRKLGEKLLEACAPTECLVFDGPEMKWEDTFLGRYLHNAVNIRHAVSDNPAKNTKAYHCANHGKFDLLYEAMKQDTENPASVYVWLDFGLLHLKDIRPKDIRTFLEKAQDFEKITIPGCWDRSAQIDNTHPCWRFCGGVIAVPRRLVEQFYKQVRSIALQTIQREMSVTFEVNTLAHLELQDVLPICWYKADHDRTILTGAP